MNIASLCNTISMLFGENHMLPASEYQVDYEQSFDSMCWQPGTLVLKGE